jgi:hypothetical protein
MIAVSIEGYDEVGRVVIKGVVLGDGKEEVVLNVFFLWTSDLLTMFIDDGVLVGVVGDGSGTRQGSEKVGEELGFWAKREWENGKDRSGQGRGGNNGNRGFSDGWQEVLDGDVSK